MTKSRVKPYLISKSESGDFHVTVRTTRFNSQGYPLVSAERLSTAFPSVGKARSYLRSEYKAEAIDITTTA